MGKPDYPDYPQQGREPTTHSTHIWRGRQNSNPGHICGRRVLSPLRLRHLFNILLRCFSFNSSLFVKPFKNGRVGNSNCCGNFYHSPVSNYIDILATNKPLPSSKTLTFKMRLVGAQPFLWKWVLFAWEWKTISISKAEYLPSFWNRGSGKLGNGLITAALDFGEKMRYFVLRQCNTIQ